MNQTLLLLRVFRMQTQILCTFIPSSLLGPPAAMVVDPTELCLEGAEVLEVWWVIIAGISGIPSAPRSFSQCRTTWKV